MVERCPCGHGPGDHRVVCYFPVCICLSLTTNSLFIYGPEKERDAALAEVERLRGALKEIASQLGNPCSTSGLRCPDVIKREGWCVGCIAREALEPSTP